MIFVVDNYDSFTFNLVQALGKLDPDVRVARNDRFEPAEVISLRPRAVVISPGPGRPERAGRTIAMIVEAERAGVPLLGVCLGHQAIAASHGGIVERAPEPRHGKSSRISHDGTGLFEGLPDPLEVMRYHSLIVERRSLPPVLRILATTGDAPDEIQAVRHVSHPVWGVQFHPESVLTQQGKRILQNFLSMAEAA